jgi:molybdate transport repressor ModE-like protein
MKALRIGHRWSHGSEPLLALLRGVQARGSLVQAAAAAGLSYRHAWGLVGQAAREFGAPLLAMQRGRGAQLTALGEKLLWADSRIAARLAPALRKLEREIGREIGALRPEAMAPLRLHASHDLALIALREAAAASVPLELQFHGSADALAALERGRCDLAGFHLPRASVPRLRGVRLIRFVTREQGLIVGRDSAIRSVRDLGRRGVRFINRQPGSGTRQLADQLLRSAGIAPASIKGYGDEEYTHLAVAATVAAGHADAGFGIRAAAAEYGLRFIPLARERYLLACRAKTFESAPMQALLVIAGSREFRARVAAMPGYDARECGQVIGRTP